MRAEYDFSKGKRGALIPTTGKTRISIYIDDAVLDGFRRRAEEAGIGYQTMMNQVLKNFLAEGDRPVTEARLRIILQEALRKAKSGSAATKRKRAVVGQSDA